MNIAMTTTYSLFILFAGIWTLKPIKTACYIVIAAYALVAFITFVGIANLLIISIFTINSLAKLATYYLTEV